MKYNQMLQEFPAAFLSFSVHFSTSCCVDAFDPIIAQFRGSATNFSASFQKTYKISPLEAQKNEKTVYITKKNHGYKILYPQLWFT